MYFKVCECVLPGGLAALMYTDTVQTFVIIAGAFVLTGFCEYKLCSIIFNLLIHTFLHATHTVDEFGLCQSLWVCHYVPTQRERLTRVSNHSFHCSSVQYADTAKPRHNTTTTLLIFPYRASIKQSNPGVDYPQSQRRRQRR